MPKDKKGRPPVKDDTGQPSKKKPEVEGPEQRFLFARKGGDRKQLPKLPPIPEFALGDSPSRKVQSRTKHQAVENVPIGTRKRNRKIFRQKEKIGRLTRQIGADNKDDEDTEEIELEQQVCDIERDEEYEEDTLSNEEAKDTDTDVTDEGAFYDQEEEEEMYSNDDEEDDTYELEITDEKAELLPRKKQYIHSRDKYHRNVMRGNEYQPEERHSLRNSGQVERKRPKSVRTSAYEEQDRTSKSRHSVLARMDKQAKGNKKFKRFWQPFQQRRDFLSPPPPTPPPRVASLQRRSFHQQNRAKSREYPGQDVDETKERPSLLLPRMTPTMKEFHQHVMNGDVNAVRFILADNPKLNINSKNQHNKTALQTAIHNNDRNMIEFLMAQEDIDMCDTVLYAVKYGNLDTIDFVLTEIDEYFPGRSKAHCVSSLNFPDNLTPLMLAAREGNMETVNFLLQRGHRIPDLHHPYCRCLDCKKELATYPDRLMYYTMKLNMYRAVANPNYLFQTSGDPIRRSFELTVDMQAASRLFPQLNPQYEEIWRKLRTFSAEFIGCCDSSEEVRLILENPAGCRDPGMLVFPRLQFAIDVQQKEFVAHPYVQAVAVLEEEWTGKDLSWIVKSPLRKAVSVIPRMIYLPFLTILSMFLPPNVGFLSKMHNPLDKLISYFSTYIIFLIILFIQSSQDKKYQKRGAPHSGLEAIIVIFVLGYIWNSLQLCFTLGPRRFFSIMWDWYDSIMLSLFVLTFIFWIIAAVDVRIHGNDDLPRKYWNATDPTLIAEGLFALAVIMAFFRLYMPLSLNYDLGPLQISIGKMTVDTFRFMFIFSLMILAWCAGLSHLYQYYDGMIQRDYTSNMNTTQVASFVNFKATFKTFFWAIFGMAPMESADVVIENIPGDEKDTSIINTHGFTEGVGYFTFALYNFLAVVVVLNMLVACMANTFTKVLDNIAVEWVFGKSQIYLMFIYQSALPPPLNLVPTMGGLLTIFKWLMLKVKSDPKEKATCSMAHCCHIEKGEKGYNRELFAKLMEKLAFKYLQLKENEKF